ncbi:MAG: tRNA-dihydrouridine synthase [Candidatus Verstraetearchaeota archaeon]|nr:tRNA-dihydrouridine synthase [Candidatus Verstraetearchaeota archaeon]
MGFDLPQGEFVIPSGVVASTPDIIQKIAAASDQIGVITTKSVGLVERDGYGEPIVAAVGGSLVNSVGLSNPGADEFVRESQGIKGSINKRGKVLMVSIFGGTPSEFAIAASKVAPCADWIELNLSCPHASGYGAAVGTCPKTVKEVVAAVKRAVDLPVFAKLTPSPGLVGEVARSAVQGGADGIVAVNTLGPLAFSSVRGWPLLKNSVGGLSGPAIREIALRCVREVRESVHVPIVGMGGISSTKDVEEFRSAGASLFGVGTALWGVGTRSIKEFFESLRNGKEWVVRPPPMEYLSFTVEEAWGRGMRVLRLGGSIDAKPGQFVQVMVPGVGEKPFSLAGASPILLLVRPVGPVSTAIASMREGDELFIRGPYGNGWEPRSVSCVVGGGSGVAPVHFASRMYGSRIRMAFIGGRTASDLPLYDEISSSVETCASTEDGSLGVGGLVTDAMRSRLTGLVGFEFMNCGPEMMMVNAAALESSVSPPEKIFCVLERYTKCGIGLCGSCAIDGYRLCVDGPVFPYSMLKEGRDFGRFKRRASGRLVDINSDVPNRP